MQGAVQAACWAHSYFQDTHPNICCPKSFFWGLNLYFAECHGVELPWFPCWS